MASIKLFGTSVTPPSAWSPQTRQVSSSRALDDEIVRDTKTGRTTARKPRYGAETKAVAYVRTPLVITCKRWLALKSPKYIAFATNPSSVNFSFRRRGSTQKTHGGAIRHAAPRRRWATQGQYDEFNVNITFQSGMIIPVLVPNRNTPLQFNMANKDELSKGGESNIPAGLNAWHMLMELLDENVIYRGRPNYHMIFYSSKKFPSLVMQGFFSNEGPDIPDEAQSQSSFEYQLQFEAWDSHPKIRKAGEMARTYIENSRDMKVNRGTQGDVPQPPPTSSIA